jgi:putative addiction module CopG family antidote
MKKLLLTPESRKFIDRRVRLGLYDNTSDVIRAGLQALSREERFLARRAWPQIAATLPKAWITPKIESRIERIIKKQRLGVAAPTQ